jgi:hypothetical protein
MIPHPIDCRVKMIRQFPSLDTFPSTGVYSPGPWTRFLYPIPTIVHLDIPVSW